MNGIDISFIIYGIGFVELDFMDWGGLHLFYELSDIDFFVLLGKQFIAIIF